MPVIPATQEAEIRSISVQSQPKQIIHVTLSQKNSITEKGCGVAQGVGGLTPVQTLVPQKNIYMFKQKNIFFSMQNNISWLQAFIKYGRKLSSPCYDHLEITTASSVLHVTKMESVSTIT
jgi:hypothetical protein